MASRRKLSADIRAKRSEFKTYQLDHGYTARRAACGGKNVYDPKGGVCVLVKNLKEAREYVANATRKSFMPQ